MLRWLATNRTNLPFLAPLSTDATVNVTVSWTFWTSFDNGVVKGFVNGCVKADVSVLGAVLVVAVADADLVFVDVVMMTFLSCWTLFLFFLFYFLSVGFATHAARGRAKTNEKSCCSFAWILLWEPVIVPFVHFVTDCAYIIINVSDEEAVITLIVLTI